MSDIEAPFASAISASGRIPNAAAASTISSGRLRWSFTDMLSDTSISTGKRRLCVRVSLTAAIGSNTVHAMQSGMVFGYVGLVEALVRRFKEELGPGTRVVATGGQASIIADETDVIEEVDPWLTLKGLRIVWELNR